MKKNNNPRSTTKHSSSTSSPGLLQALNKMIRNEGGSVSFIFLEDRLERRNFVNKKHEDDFFMDPIQKKSIQHLKIGLPALESDKKFGELKSAEELALMLQGIKDDLGANHFIVD